MADDPDGPGALPGAIGGISGASLAPALTDWLNYLSCPATTADQLSCLPQRLPAASVPGAARARRRGALRRTLVT